MGLKSVLKIQGPGKFLNSDLQSWKTVLANRSFLTAKKNSQQKTATIVASVKHL